MEQVDLLKSEFQVGKAKTAGSGGRVIPLNQAAIAAFREWRKRWPEESVFQLCSAHIATPCSMRFLVIRRCWTRIVTPISGGCNARIYVVNKSIFSSARREKLRAMYPQIPHS